MTLNRSKPTGPLSGAPGGARLWMGATVLVGIAGFWAGCTFEESPADLAPVNKSPTAVATVEGFPARSANCKTLPGLGR